jgi:hypothetical protein
MDPMGMNLFSKEVDWNDTKYQEKVGSFHRFIRDEDTNQDKEKSHVEICTQKYGDISPGDTFQDKWVINSNGIFNQSTCCHEGFGYTDILMHVWEKTMKSGSVARKHSMNKEA